MARHDPILVPARFNGPPDSGNGGYSAGLLAARLSGPATVELRAPPPLDTPLDVLTTDTGLEARNGDTLVMRARPGGPDLKAPAAPPLDVVREGAKQYPGCDDHALPTCFVCGPARDPRDGLCLRTGPLTGTPLVGDVWTPMDDLGDEQGYVRPEILWAALDCPSCFAIPELGNPILLGRISARIDVRPRVSEPVAVIGWHAHSDGRKHQTGTALYGVDGTLLAQSDTLWIELKPR